LGRVLSLQPRHVRDVAPDRRHPRTPSLSGFFGLSGLVWSGLSVLASAWSEKWPASWPLRTWRIWRWTKKRARHPQAAAGATEKQERWRSRAESRRRDETCSERGTGPNPEGWPIRIPSLEAMTGAGDAVSGRSRAVGRNALAVLLRLIGGLLAARLIANL